MSDYKTNALEYGNAAADRIRELEAEVEQLNQSLEWYDHRANEAEQLSERLRGLLKQVDDTGCYHCNGKGLELHAEVKRLRGLLRELGQPIHSLAMLEDATDETRALWSQIGAALENAAAAIGVEFN